MLQSVRWREPSDQMQCLAPTLRLLETEFLGGMSMTFDAFDWIARLLPAAGIIAGGFGAWTQLKAARRATATTIAKNYYRKMLDQFLRNSDVLYAGTDLESFK